MTVIERTQAERDAEAKALGFVPASDDITQAERRGYCKGWDAAVTHSKTIKGAVEAVRAHYDGWVKANGRASGNMRPADRELWIAVLGPEFGGQ